MNVRRIVEWGVPALAVAVIALLPSAFLDRLPEPVASHWQFDGRPDGSLPLAIEWALFVTVAAVASGGLLVATSATLSRRVARCQVAGAHALAAFFVMLRWWTLQANAGVETWQQAEQIQAGLVAGLVAGAATGGVIGWWAGGHHAQRAAREVPPTPVEAAAGEDAVWSGSATARIRLLLPVAALVLVGLALLLQQAEVRIWLGVAALVAVVIALVLTRVRLTVGGHGVRITLGALSHPRITVPLEEITGVSAEQVEPMAYGGWGYRVVPGVRAIIVKRGQGLRIGRRGKADLIVTVDDAATAAGVLRAHMLRTGG